MPATPPLPAARPVSTVRHGETFVDPYAWLREKEDAAVRAHLETENAYGNGSISR
jgi:oligopeptidase B